MFEINMDEYLDEEVESVKQALDVICKGWERQVGSHSIFLYLCHISYLARRNFVSYEHRSVSDLPQPCPSEKKRAGLFYQRLVASRYDCSEDCWSCGWRHHNWRYRRRSRDRNAQPSEMGRWWRGHVQRVFQEFGQGWRNAL